MDFCQDIAIRYQLSAAFLLMLALKLVESLIQESYCIHNMKIRSLSPILLPPRGGPVRGSEAPSRAKSLREPDYHPLAFVT